MLTPKRSRAAFGGVGAVVVLGIGASFAIGTTDDKTNSIRAGLDGAKPKSVIYFLGDGMGTQEITAARYYKYGADGKLNVDSLPYTGFDKTWSVKPDGKTVDYDPDSAATGTMWSTGKKTMDDRDSMGPSTSGTVGNISDYKTVLEYAQQDGKKVGDITTADVTDATPAVLSAHISNRNCSGPAQMATATPPCPQETKGAGGLGSIAEQEVDHKMDVLMGGGRSRFDQTITTGGPDNGKTVTQSAQDKGINVGFDKASMDAAGSDKPFYGIFGPASGGNSPNMSLEWKGSVATVGNGSAQETCQENQRPSNEPSLSDMTKKSLDLLDNPKGFFLQVEGASIDKQDHAANACQQIGETVAFDNAIGVALEYQKTHPDTLIVVTADHAHTSQIVAEDTGTASGNPTGYTNNLTTKDGQDLRITYGTAGYGGTTTGASGPSSAAPVAAPPSMQHTGSVVPVWAGGPQGVSVLGTNDHTDLFDLLRGTKDAQGAPAAGGTTTVTVPGPATTVTGPTKTVPDTTPRVSVAAISRISRASLRKSGIPISVSALNATSLKVSIKRGSKTVASKTLTATGATTLKYKASKTGRYTVTVTGGGKSASKTFTVTK